MPNQKRIKTRTMKQIRTHNMKHAKLNNKKKTETVHEISNMPKLKKTSPNKSGQLHVGHAKR